MYKNKSLKRHEVLSMAKMLKPYYFSRNTLKFFGQTMKSFKVQRLGEYTYRMYAPTYMDKKYMGDSVSIINVKEGIFKNVGVCKLGVN